MNNESKCHQEWIKDLNGHIGEGYVEFIYNYYDDGKHWLRAGVKFSGCVNLSRAFNVPFPREDKSEMEGNFHICDIDDMIKQLILLKEVAKKHFGEEWGED